MRLVMLLLLLPSLLPRRVLASRSLSSTPPIGRRPQGRDRDRRAGPSACGARAHRRHDRFAHDQGRRRVAAGAEIAVVADQKLALADAGARLAHRVAAVPARPGARPTSTACSELQQRGVEHASPARPGANQSRRRRTQPHRDGRTASVIAQQASEGAVLGAGGGPCAHRPVSVGRVVLPGETIATLAEDQLHPAPAAARAPCPVSARRATRF